MYLTWLGTSHFHNLDLDDIDRLTTCPQGWTAPGAGRFKAGVIESSSAKDGYDAATPNGNSITSENEYQGEDEDGNPVRIKFQISAAPGNEPMFVVTQVRL